jgi:hypothetical protein
MVEEIMKTYISDLINDKNNFSLNLGKFIFLLLLVTPLILFLGMPFVWITIFILILAMNLLKFKKEAFLWSFGMMLLYGLLGLIPISSIIFFNDFDLRQGIESVIHNISSIITIVLAGYFVKGAIFGAILQMLFNKQLKKSMENVNE